MHNVRTLLSRVFRVSSNQIGCSILVIYGIHGVYVYCINFTLDKIGVSNTSQCVLNLAQAQDTGKQCINDLIAFITFWKKRGREANRERGAFALCCRCSCVTFCTGLALCFSEIKSSSIVFIYKYFLFHFFINPFKSFHGRLK